MTSEIIASRAKAGAKAKTLSPAVLFTHAICVMCLILQRFGLPFAHGSLFISLVLAPIAFLFLVMTRQAKVSSKSFLFFGLMLCCLLSSALAAILFPDSEMRFSMLSIMELLAIYSFFVLRPSRNFDTSAVFPIFLFYARLIAILALAQFLLQFAHIRLFSFARLMPQARSFLTEGGYNVVAPIKYGSAINRSNGFFLLEPSILSQVMVIAIVVDYFILSRLAFLPLYAFAILVSFSGTGPLSLAVTLAIAGLMSPRQIQRTIIFGVISIIAIVLFALALPSEFSTLAARATGQDASAHMRYGVQLDALKSVMNDPRAPVGFGPGAIEGNVATGSSSLILKLVFDYGFLGLIGFLTFLVVVVWRRDIPIISLICLSIFQLGGGYLVFPPFLFLMALLCIWSRPDETGLIITRRRSRSFDRKMNAYSRSAT